MAFPLFAWLKNKFSRHYLALLGALLVGLIYVGPHLWFMFSLGDQYRGLPMMQTANEDYYLARIQEIIDGHWLVSSQGFYEYKDQVPLAPPTIELVYALPSLLLGVSTVDVLIASRFILPFLLFLLVYVLLRRLTGNLDIFANKINAIAGALLVTLGYDLVDYRTVWGFISGQIEPGGFLVWARPVNPIGGAILLFGFLILIAGLPDKANKKYIRIVGAAFLLALMVASYIFSWTLALAIVGILFLIYWFKRDGGVVRRLAAVVGLGAIFSLPYWYISWLAKGSEWYQAALERSGIFYTHYPLFNKFALAVLLVCVVAFVAARADIKKHLVDWHWFILSLVLGSLAVYTQQLVTGVTVWPYHYVQYTIPLGMVVIMVLGYRLFYPSARYVWGSGVAMIIGASVFYGVFVQLGTTKIFYKYYRDLQPYADVFDWFNQQEKDCVALVSAAAPPVNELNGLIPALTHCNTYAHTWTYSLLPEERIYHNYFVNLRLRGVTPETIEEYLEHNRAEAGVYLSSNWKGLYGVTQFPDFADLKLPVRLARLPNDYHEWFRKDFKTELQKYRLDYILSSGPLPKQIKNELPDVKLVKQINGVFIYSFQKN